MNSFIQYNITALEQKLYPYTVKHIVYFLIISVVTYYVTEYLVGFRLIRWIYVGTSIVIIANLYKSGNSDKAATEIFKLATL
jgi:hypothetical protein